MGNNNSNSRSNTEILFGIDGSKHYKWDPKSAGRKLTGNYDPKKDALRNCKNCGKHRNYHNAFGSHKPMRGTLVKPPPKCPEQRTIPGIEGVITDRGLVTRKGTVGR